MPDLELYRPRRDGWLDRLKRSITLGPWNPKDPAIARYFGGRPASSGVSVNEQTALNYSAVWACTNVVATDVSAVPLPLYRVNGDGKQRFREHSLYRVIHDQPNPWMGSMTFRQTLQAHVLIWGNGYAEIERDQAGRVKYLWPILPWQVTPFYERGELRYRVQNPTEPPIIFRPEEIIHVRGLGEDGILGYSVIQKARESMGLGLAAERFGGTFFGNGSSFGGIISYPPGVAKDEKVRTENRQSLEAQHMGVDRAHRFLALYEGAKYERIGIPPNDAQFLETRTFQVEEICRWFRVAPHKVQHLLRSTNNNIEHQSIEHDTDTLNPWWVRWEEELTIKLISPLERAQQVIEHVREGRLQADSDSRSDLQSKQFSIAMLTANEGRAMENRNPIRGGDRAFVALNLIPLDMVKDYWQAKIDLDLAEIEVKKRPPEPPPTPAPAPKEDDDDRNTQLMFARKAAQAAEDARDLAIQLRDEAQRKLAEVAAVHDETAIRFAEAQQDLDSTRADVKLKEEALLAALTERNGAKADALRIADDFEREVMARSNAVAELKLEKIARAGVEQARDTIAAEAETLKTDLARARADLATELDQQKAQRGALLAAMRGLFVDATERLLTKETLAARKHQATPEKLRSWVESFYPVHADTVRTVFRPLVGPWTTIAGGEPAVLLERLVRAHVETSQRALSVALLDDDDTRAAALERTFRRWEEERGDAVADALLREGMGQ